MAALMNKAREALVVGLGASGVSALRYLRGRGWRVRATDADSALAGRAGEAWCEGGEALRAMSSIDMLVVSPGVPLTSDLVTVARRSGVDVVNDVELFAREVRAPVVAITGTNGKSTVTSLVAAMARAAGRRSAAGGNLGPAALELLAPGIELYVLELSSFQLEVVESLSPAAAAVLNVSADHLDRHGSLEAYAAAKARIYRHAESAVANRDDPRVAAMLDGREGGVTFGLDVPSPGHYGLRESGGRLVLCRGPETLMDAADVPLAGRHNLSNVLAAWALAAAAGVPDAAIAGAVRAFRPLPHRLTPVGERGGVRYLDDSKATNVSAAVASLGGLAGPLVVIAGGQGKGQDFAAFAHTLAGRARGAVLIGRDAPLIERALAGRVPVAYAGSMDEAVSLAAEMARPGDEVVLAPACASLDMFRNYEERGEAFVRAVEGLHGD